MRLTFTAFAAAALFATVSSAAAKTKSFIVEGTDLRAFNGGAITAGSVSTDGVLLAETGFGEVTVHFTLPKDYKKDSPVAITLRMFGGGVSCNVNFEPSFVKRYRNNATLTTAIAGDGGLTANGATVFARPADFLSVQSRGYTLRKAGNGTLITGSIRNQRPGDSIITGFLRSAAGGSDTCDSTLVITSAKITYTTQ